MAVTTTIKARRRRRPPGDRAATLAFWAFVSPALIGLTVFTLVPIVWGFLLSLSHAQNTIHVGHFIGLRNYADLLTDEEFLRSLLTILIFALFIVPLTFAVSLGLALLVNRAGRGTAFFRTVFFIPSAVSYVVASLIWRVSLFNGTPFGFANHVLGSLGLIHQPIVWIGTPSPPWYWLVLVTARLWLQVGFYMIIFIAGLQEIPRSLYEAAAVDGASPGWTMLRYITLPQLRATSISVLLLNLIAAFQAFDEFYNILGGTGSSVGNAALARPPLVYLYSVALSQQDFGRGSAGGFILTALIFAVTLIQGRLFGFGESEK
ncbi:MAG: sugar ABC transporter permease [Armatimonadetes bacterium]|nr:sugar ABC transporter permease [Armatimonadota bacterium]